MKTSRPGGPNRQGRERQRIDSKRDLPGKQTLVETVAEAAARTEAERAVVTAVLSLIDPDQRAQVTSEGLRI